MKIGIHIRVSTQDQAKEDYSLEVQREYLESFAKRAKRGYNQTSMELPDNALLD